MPFSEIKFVAKDWTIRDSVYHTVFWLILFTIMLVSGIPYTNFLQALYTDLLSLIFYGLIVYFNYFYLFPKYLKDKNLWWHLGALALAALILSPIKVLLLFCHQQETQNCNRVMSMIGFLCLFPFFWWACPLQFIKSWMTGLSSSG
ncbi:MAG: hypothetical protein IPN89_10720 [Saprospiraceae bacterium]|nr:hypothetical protein [Saprospiraceae bacterium]